MWLLPIRTQQKKIRLIDFQKCVRKKKSVVHALYLRITTNNNFDDPCCRVPNDSNSHTYIQLNQAPNAAMHNHTKIKLKKKMHRETDQTAILIHILMASGNGNTKPSPFTDGAIDNSNNRWLLFVFHNSEQLLFRNAAQQFNQSEQNWFSAIYFGVNTIAWPI